MVKVTPVKENEEQFGASDKAEAYVSDSDSGASDNEFDDDEDFEYGNESLYDRLVALKDVVPPQYRSQISNTFGSTYSAVASAFSFSGQALWVITTSSILLGVPLSLSILSEQQLIEMEKEMKLNQSTNELLAPGAESGFQPAPVAQA